MYFVCILYNDYPFVAGRLSAFSWHGHELLFASTQALIMGFILTASPHWSGKRPLSNLWVVFLFHYWILLRLLFFFDLLPGLLFLVLSLVIPVFIVFSLVWYLKEHRHFLPLISAMFFFTIAQVLYLLTAYSYIDLSYRNNSLLLASLALFYFLFYFSGQLIPFFSKTRLKSDSAKTIALLDRTIIVASTFSFALLPFVTWKFLATVLILLSAFLMMARSFFLWDRSDRPMFEMIKDALLFPLHLGHFWLVIFLILIAFENYFYDFSVAMPAFHALYTGALATLALSVMTRASLGHTGRELVSSYYLVAIFFLIQLGAIGRVFLPLIWQSMSATLMHSVMGVWTLAFIFFLIKFLPIYLQPRADR